MQKGQRQRPFRCFFWGGGASSGGRTLSDSGQTLGSIWGQEAKREANDLAGDERGNEPQTIDGRLQQLKIVRHGIVLRVRLHIK